MAKEVTENKIVYQCEKCGKSYKNEADALMCENQSISRAEPLYGLYGWVEGDYAITFSSKNGDRVDIKLIDKIFEQDHKLYPFDPERKKERGFTFLGVVRKSDLP